MALTLSGTNGVVGAGFTLDPSGTSVTSGIGTFSKIAVGANNVNPTQALEVKGSSSVAIQVESSAAQYSEVQINNSTKSYTVGVRPDISHGFAIRDASAATNRFTIDTSGNATVNSGNLVIGTDGKGIDFSAAGNAGGMTSELLDDYEEGTFSPSINGTSTAGSWSGSGGHGGFYVKIGKQVTCWINASGSLSGAAGNLNVYGLPFTSAGNNQPAGAGNANYSSGTCQYWSGINVDILGALVPTGTTYIYFHSDNGSSTGGQPGVGNGGHNLHCIVTYFVS